MVSLSPPANSGHGPLLKHTYLCLGKQKVPYQDLLFFISFDLKLVKPRNCEKLIEMGRADGYLSIGEQKIVTFNVDKLFYAGADGKLRDLDMNTLIHRLTTDAIADKAFILKKQLDASSLRTGEKGTLLVDFNEGIDSSSAKVTRIEIDEKRREIVQWVDEPMEGLKGNPLLSKHAVAFLFVNRDNPRFLALFNKVLREKESWKFTFINKEEKN